MLFAEVRPTRLHLLLSWSSPLCVDGSAVRDGRHAHDGRLVFASFTRGNEKKDARLKMDAVGLVGGDPIPLSGGLIGDILHRLEIRQTIEIDVWLFVEAAVWNFTQRRAKGPLLCGEV